MKHRCRSFDIANGSALECAACLDVLVARAKLTAEQVEPGKERLSRIVKMLIGLAKRLTERNYEAAPEKPR
jgi:four helix bundle protein